MKKKIAIIITIAIVVAAVIVAVQFLMPAVPADEAGIPDLQEGFGIYGSEVKFDGMYPGYSGNASITIINGQDKDRTFSVTITDANTLTKGYEGLPAQYFYWVNITKPEVTISAEGMEEILIVLTMPEDADYRGKHAQFGIRVGDLTQTGLVQIALESKWYIITAP